MYTIETGCLKLDLSRGSKKARTGAGAVPGPTDVFLFRIVGVRPVLSWASTAVYVREQCRLYVLGSEMRAS